MASSKQSTGLIVTVSFIDRPWWRRFAVDMQFRELADNQAKFTQAQADLQKEQQASKNLDDQIQTLKQLTGYPQPDVGSLEDGAAGSNTMVGAMGVDMAKVDGTYPIANKTLAATIETLLQKATDLDAELNQAQTEIGTNNQAYTQRESELNAKVQNTKRPVARPRLTIRNSSAARTRKFAKQAQVEELRRNLTDSCRSRSTMPKPHGTPNAMIGRAN